MELSPKFLNWGSLVEMNPKIMIAETIVRMLFNVSKGILKLLS